MRKTKAAIGICNIKVTRVVMKKRKEGWEKNSTPPEPSHEPMTEIQISVKPLPRHGGNRPLKSKIALRKRRRVRTRDRNVRKTRMKKTSCIGTVVRTRCPQPQQVTSEANK